MVVTEFPRLHRFTFLATCPILGWDYVCGALEQDGKKCQYIVSKQMSFVNVTDGGNQLEALNVRTLSTGCYMLTLEKFGEITHGLTT